MDLNNKLEWMYSLEAKGIKFGLDRIESLAKALDNPQDKFPCIHIAGSNGKGSVSKMLYTILREAGYSVGLYTSPHLVKFNERIVVDNQEIDDKDVERLMEKIKSVIEAEKIDTTFFEFTTAIAFAYFDEKKVDIAVIETGMGGRLDATNIVKPMLSIITRVSLEHQEHLGDSIEKIAFEKAGIIKQGVPVVTPNTSKALEVIESVCNEKKSELVLVKEVSEIKTSESGLEFQKMKINTSKDSYSMKTSILGEHQAENISTVVVACEVISRVLGSKSKITKESIEKGLNNTTWPARLEVVRKKPLIILDGSHNLEGFRSLRLFLEQNVQNKFDKITVVLGISEDKDKELMIPLIADIGDEFILCQANYKGTYTKELKDLLVKHNKNNKVNKHTQKVFEIKDVAHAVKKAFEDSEEGDAIIITGSLYVAGEAKQSLS